MILVNNRDKIEWQPDLTVALLLEKLDYSYSLITVTINDHLIQDEDYHNTMIPDQASVIVFHLAHGG